MEFIPYHRGSFDHLEEEELIATLRSGWLTAGPRVKAFEEQFSSLKNGRPSVALNSCTSGLFLALKEAGISEGDEVITTPMTFAATANTVIHCGATPVFADVDSASMNIDPEEVIRRWTPQTKAVVVVHVGGDACEMDPILDFAKEKGLAVIEDCAHAIEGTYKGRPLGALGDAGVFSFYPTKNISSAEGGMLVCRGEGMEKNIRMLSRHGLDSGIYEREGSRGYPFYDILLPGYKCNMTDLQAALCLVQMQKLEAMYQRRQEIDRRYRDLFAGVEGLRTIAPLPHSKSSLHLFRLELDCTRMTTDRDAFVRGVRKRGVQLSVNYLPVHLFTYYRKIGGYKEGDLPHAERGGKQLISLPFYPALKDAEIDRVATTILEVFEEMRG